MQKNEILGSEYIFLRIFYWTSLQWNFLPEDRREGQGIILGEGPQKKFRKNVEYGMKDHKTNFDNFFYFAYWSYYVC